MKDVILTNALAVINDVVNREVEWADESTDDIEEAWNIIKQHIKEEEAQASFVLVRELAALEASSKTKKSACLAAHSPQVINKKNKVRK